tara:strand:- start:1393 stop:1938 length:546 start_codon:yes stop_codon:yes gene_type:complete
VLKNQIRKKILKIRKAKNSYLCEIEANKLFKIIKKTKIKKVIIGCYYPVNSEINTKKIMKFLEKKKFIICLPIIKNNLDMEFYEYKSEDPLYVNKYGIPEPINKRKKKPNILLIPIVAFDRKLNRLGYGGGFYDRFLEKMEKYKILKIGLAFSYQRIKNVPIEKFDKKLDYILTEKEIFTK